MSTLLTRSFSDIEIREADDGRTVFGRVVPYDVPALVADSLTGEPYTEVFVRGSFAGADGAADRIDLRYTHRGVFENVLGAGQRFEERDDGLWGTFRLYESVAPKAREVLVGHAKNLSVGFVPIKSRRRRGVVERVKAYLEHVAAVPNPAYVGAEVIAIRETSSTLEVETPPETPTLEEVQEWLKDAQAGPMSVERYVRESTPSLYDVQQYLRTLRQF